MYRTFVTMLLVALGLTTSGCIETQMLVTVNSDGSGMIEERMLFNKMMIGMLEGMGQSLKTAGEEGDTEEPQEPFSMFSEDDVIERAAKMGAGVKLVSYEEVESTTGKGYTARFTFDDINAINMDQNPGSALPDMPGEEQGEEEKEERVRFQFTPGSPARLVIVPFIDEEELDEVEEMVEEEMPEADDESESGESDMEFEQMKEFFRGMRMSLAVKVNGTIKETNAQFVDGSTVTLIDFNFDQLLDNPEALKELEKSEEMSPAAAQEVLKGIEGIKFDIDDDIVVTFD